MGRNFSGRKRDTAPLALRRASPVRSKLCLRRNTTASVVVFAALRLNLAMLPLRGRSRHQGANQYSFSATRKGTPFGCLSVAEKEGFEPSLRYSHTTPLAGEPLEPLGYFSKVSILIIILSCFYCPLTC